LLTVRGGRLLGWVEMASSRFQRITVFCGSSAGFDSALVKVAYGLGQTLADAGIELVYGGAKVGLMGAVADGCLARGGSVIGVLPGFLRHKEIAHEGLSELIIVESMHERKQRMHALSDGAMALPGGFGTLEEYFELLTWAQLGLHEKPVGLLNWDGFFDGLLEMAETMVARGLLKPVNREMMLVGASGEELLAKMEGYVAPVVRKWIELGEV
jgi:uncharacterized protein (TIGR00730 family)